MTQASSPLQYLRMAMAQLIEEKAVFEGEFKCSSGDKTDYYIDMAMIFSEPTGLEIALSLTLAELRRISVDKIASPSVEADPIVAVVGTHAKLGSIFIHQGQPIYAYEKLENLLKNGNKVAVIADVTLCGNAILSAVKTLRAAGAQVDTAITIVDLQRGASELLKENGIRLVPLIEAKDIGSIARRQK